MFLFIGNILVIVVVAIVVLLFVLISLFIRWYKKPKMGTAIVRTGSADGARVCFEKGIFVIPVIHEFELLDITMKTFSIDLSGHDAIILENGLKIDVKIVFFVRIPNNHEDVLKIATTIGCERASKKETIKELFYIKFSEMIKDVAANLGINSKDKTRFREMLLHTIGADLNGFVLDDCAIEYLKVTEPISDKNKNL